MRLYSIGSDHNLRVWYSVFGILCGACILCCGLLTSGRFSGEGQPGKNAEHNQRLSGVLCAAASYTFGIYLLHPLLARCRHRPESVGYPAGAAVSPPALPHRLPPVSSDRNRRHLFRESPGLYSAAQCQKAGSADYGATATPGPTVNSVCSAMRPYSFSR